MDEQKEKVILKFEYTDENVQSTKLERNLSLNSLEDGVCSIDVMVSEYKQFLIAAGFSRELVDTIQIVEKN